MKLSDCYLKMKGPETGPSSLENRNEEYMAKDTGYGTTVESTDSAAVWVFKYASNVLSFNPDLMRKALEIGNNDAGKGGKAEYLTMDTNKLAEQIIAGSSERGSILAFTLLKKLGWAPTEIRTAQITLSYLSPGNGDKLQPEVSVATGRESGGFEDHYPR